MSRRSFFGGFAIAVAMLAYSTSPLADMPVLLERCVGCHNESGVTDNPDIPTLAGAGSFYLENQFIEFSDRNRPCIVDVLEDEIDKCALIGVLTEAQKSELTAYFAGRPNRPFEQDYDPELAERGAPIHAERCERCHTESGREPLDDAGLLAGQPIPYLVRQMGYFAEGRRWQSDVMAAEIEDLEPADFRALAHFYARAGLEAQD